MASATYFPVLMRPSERREFPAAPSFIPWDLVEPHREMAATNHYQTLERLAERGGLHPVEFYMVARGLRWTALEAPPVDTRQALEFIARLIEERNEGRKSQGPRP